MTFSDFEIFLSSSCNITVCRCGLKLTLIAALQWSAAAKSLLQSPLPPQQQLILQTSLEITSQAGAGKGAWLAAWSASSFFFFLIRSDNQNLE